MMKTLRPRPGSLKIRFPRVGQLDLIGAKATNIKRALFIPLIVFTLLSSTIWNYHSSEAATVTVDVCQWVITEVFIPPTYQDIVTCSYDWYICAFVDPSCCVPVVCNTLPHCFITQTVVNVAGHWSDEWVWECHPEDLDPAVEWKKWLRRQIPSLDHLLLPGAFEAAKLDVQAMKLAASPIPGEVRAQVLGLIQPFTTAGTAKFSSAEVNNTRIISNSDSNASLYLRSGFDAITLYDLVIIRNTDYDALMNVSYHDYTVAQIISGNAPSNYVGALLLLIHELVHVKQYSSLGFDAFLTNYLIETISKGYGSDSFEQEAYTFEYDVAQTIAGDQQPEIEVVQAVARALGVSAEGVAADVARWKEIAIWFKVCVKGKQTTPGIFGRKRIEEKDCVSAAVREFGITVDRARFPLKVKTTRPTEKLKTRKGKEVIIPPKPTSP